MLRILDQKKELDTFGEWVRANRKELRLTRQQLAERVGCSVAMLRKIEDGERRASSQIAELLANCLNIPPGERPIFVKVARGELSVDRLPPTLGPNTNTSGLPPSTTLRSNLPAFLTPLVGRQYELDQLSQLLNNPKCRLLTLVGPGGIGKTRLAIEAASQLQASFADGAYFVSFTPVSTTRFIVPVIADAMGFAFEPESQADPRTQLFNYLRGKQTLLVLDNLEHLLAGPGIEVLAELLANAPKMKLLNTSRESLELRAEWVFEVQGLPIPESGQTEESVQNTSVQLFLQRARRAHVRFNPTAEDYAAIVRICQFVEGMPLGIELAAAWVRTLSCDEIAREIEGGLDFLSVSTRDLPARHRSLRAVFDHSWRLLSEKEQTVLRRLATFHGGFRREAAEQIAGATLSVLSAFVMKSLIRRTGAERYDLHELIRQFAGEHLSEGAEERAAAHARHSRYYLMSFSQAAVRLRSSAQRETLAELTAEMDNFRAAWDWAISQGEFALIEQTLRTFAMLYDTRGWFQPGFDDLAGAVRMLETAHEHSPSDRTIQLTLAHLLIAQALFALRLARPGEAQAMFERSLTLLRPLNEPRVLVEAITFLGIVMETTGNYARAMELYSEGLEIAAAIDDRWFAALCFTFVTELGGISQSMVQPEITHERFQVAVANWRAIGDPRLTAIVLNNLSWSALRLGRYDQAAAALEESVGLSRSVGDRWGLGYAYRGLGRIAQAQGEHQRAVDLFRKSVNTLTELGARQDVARVLAEMGTSACALGNYTDAGQMWRESMRLAIETEGTFIALEALVGLAGLEAKRGNREHALELLLVVLNHPVTVQETKNRAANLRIELEAQLTSRQVEMAQARAEAKALDGIVDQVLQPSTSAERLSE